MKAILLILVAALGLSACYVGPYRERSYRYERWERVEHAPHHR